MVLILCEVLDTDKKLATKLPIIDLSVRNGKRKSATCHFFKMKFLLY